MNFLSVLNESRAGLARGIWVVLLSGAFFLGCTAAPKAVNQADGRTPPSVPAPVAGQEQAETKPTRAHRIALELEAQWQLNLPKGERFDASGLSERKDGTLLTINDREAAVYEIRFQRRTNSADLIKLPGLFTAEQLAPFTKEKIDRYDIEGIALDEEGRIYLSEEANRWILR